MINTRKIPWMKEELYELVRLIREGKSNAEISARIGRTPKAIQHKRFELGLTEEWLGACRKKPYEPPRLTVKPLRREEQERIVFEARQQPAKLTEPQTHHPGAIRNAAHAFDALADSIKAMNAAEHAKVTEAAVCGAYKTVDERGNRYTRVPGDCANRQSNMEKWMRELDVRITAIEAFNSHSAIWRLFHRYKRPDIHRKPYPWLVLSNLRGAAEEKHTAHPHL